MLCTKNASESIFFSFFISVSPCVSCFGRVVGLRVIVFPLGHAAWELDCCVTIYWQYQQMEGLNETMDGMM